MRIGIYQANLGLIYMKKGLLEQAHLICTTAWTLGNKKKNNETMEQANYCLEQIKKAMQG